MAKRTTIDFGIDLGTTNSAIAVQNNVQPDIIKNDQQDTTSSAVYIDKHGRIRVGSRARAKQLDERAVDDVYVEFKQLMGTDHVYEFASSGQRKSPEELSAEVLKSLCAAVEEQTGEQVRAAVITVPAAFEQKQCTATMEAAKLLGLRKIALLHEPVAAALAYGFQADAQNEYWFVYDFGGGTFDAALLKADDGVIDVVNHGGNNHLGGANIDWAIVENIILPKVARLGNFSDLRRGNDQYRTTIARIKHAAEIAKIELSSKEETDLLDCLIEDDDGEEIEVDLSLTREEVIALARPIIRSTVKTCLRVLKEKDMTPAMVDKVILVGGPILAPYFRDMLSEELGVELDFSIDPMTVVARGAAVFAGTQQFTDDEEPVQAGTCRLELNYNPVGPDEDFRVRGTVLADGDDLSGYTIRFKNTLTGWASVAIPVKSDGKFKADLLAEEPNARNVFRIELADGQGTVRDTAPAELTYTVGAHPGSQIVTNSLGLEIGDNEYDILIKKGTPLPASRRMDYKTRKALRKGETGDVLSVPVVEGEMPKADRNRLQGELIVTGKHIRRDLPAQSEVEVTLLMDTNRMITVRALIPLLDEEFEAHIQPEMRVPDTKRLEKELEDERKRCRELSSKVGSSEDLREQEAKFDDLDRLIRTAHGDAQAAIDAEAKVLALKASLDRIEDDTHWPELVAKAREELDDLDGLIGRSSGVSSEQEQRARELRKETEELIANHREELLPNSN